MDLAGSRGSRRFGGGEYSRRLAVGGSFLDASQMADSDYESLPGGDLGGRMSVQVSILVVRRTYENQEWTVRGLWPQPKSFVNQFQI